MCLIWGIALLIIGILLRLYRISQESISLEEYACIANLNIKTIPHFIHEQRNTYPYGGILFPLLQYFWGKCFGTGIVSLRLFSLSFWTAVYLMFWVALDRFEKQNKLPSGSKVIVAIGLVLSPSLIFVGQEARMYIAYLFFIWLSFFLFVEVIENVSNKKLIIWWIITNQLLLWTHHIGVIVWTTEFLLLLIINFKNKGYLKKAVFLVAIHSLLLLPWFVWILTIPSQPAELHRYYLKPSLWQLLSFPFVLNLPGKGGICPVGIVQPWQYSTTWFPAFLHHSQIGFEFALLLFSALGLLGLLYGYIQTWIKKESFHRMPLLLLSLFIIPPLLLFLLARLGPPIFTTRYIVFLIPLHFIGLGYFLPQTRKILSSFLIALLVMVLLYPIGIMTQSSWRMDWKGVGKTISENSKAQDLVILRDPFWMPMFKLNNTNISISVSDAYTEEGLIELAKVYFMALGKQENKHVKVWLIIPDVYGTGLNTFPMLLKQHGFPFFVQVFPGEQRIYLYRVSPPQDVLQQDIFTVNIEINKLIRKIFKEGNPLTEKFYQQHRYEHDRTLFHFIRCAIELAKHKKHKQAGYLLKSAWERNPNLIIQTYEVFSPAVNFERECRLLDSANSKKDLTVLFWNGVKCFSEHDYVGAIPYFSELVNKYDTEPLFWWFLAQTCDKISRIDEANWSWTMLFHLQPVLPLGWHFIYHPSAITCDKTAVENAFRRAEILQIVTEHLISGIDYSLLK